MEISETLLAYLDSRDINYDRLSHRHTESSVNSAHAAHIPEEQLAKSVILEDDKGYVMAVVPAHAHVKIGELNRLLNRKMGLATEVELLPLFNDCELGAIPPVGQAYGMETIVDRGLDDCSDVYFESGNHVDLIHIRGDAFRELMKETRHASICMH